MPKAKKVATKAPAKKTVKAKEPKYTVTLGYNEQEVVLKGDDLTELFNNYEPDVIKSRVNVVVKSGKNTIERLWPVFKARRVFRNYNNSVIEAGNLVKFFNE